MTETWKYRIENGKVIGAIFIDFAKAFHSVDHSILHHKLQACGITGNLLNFLQSYLSQCTQHVEINRKKSRLRIVEDGVPRGSLLGPRLYTIYVNDFPSSIKSSEVHLYADDTTAFVIGNNTHQVTELLNILFKELNDWCDRNKVTIHTGRSEAMMIQKRPFIGPLAGSRI